MDWRNVNSFTGEKRTGVKTLSGVVNFEDSATNTPIDAIQNMMSSFVAEYKEFYNSNLKNKTLIELANADTTFSNQYLNDPLVYTNQEKFETMLKGYQGLLKEKRNIIHNSGMLKHEKELLLKKQQVMDAQKLNDLQFKRNQMYIKTVYDDALLNKNQLETIGANLDPSQTEMFNEVVNGIQETGKHFIKAGIDNVKTASIIGESLGEIEFSRKNKELWNSLSSDNLSYDEKKKMLKEYKKNILSDKTINPIVDKYSSKYTDEERDAFRQSVLTRASLIQSGSDRDIIALEREIETNEKNRQNALKQQKVLRDKEKRTIDKIRRAINENDPYKFIEAKFGFSTTTNEFVNDNYLLNEVFKTSLSEIGNENNREVADIISKGDLDKIKNTISNFRAEGRSSLEIIDEVIYPYVEEISKGDAFVKNALLKNIGMKLKGFSPTVLLKAKENPHIVKTNDLYNNGVNTRQSLEVEEPGFFANIFGGGSYLYHSLMNEIGNTPLNRSKVNNLIFGMMSQAGVKINKVKFQNFINENYKDIKDNVNNLLDLQINPLNYQLKPIRTDNLKKRETYQSKLDYLEEEQDNDDNFLDF